MTVFVPLQASSPFPQAPSFLMPSPEPAAHVKKVVKAVMKARRIAVVCGAGISVQAGIPDFRSSDGLFQSLKKDNPALSSGKDLFDASVFNSEGTTSMFCQMIAQLSELSETAVPTSFHKLLRVLDDRRRLLRVYTQNIDALEQKSGLTFGVPEVDCKRYKYRSTKGRHDVPEDPGPSTAVEPPHIRLLTPPMETPRCIPLHGTLQSMHCQTCTHSFPLREYLPALSEGRPPYCPECTAVEETRQLVGKRSRGVGKLRPSVVLYNEMHKDGEEVGDIVRRDLIGSSKGKGRAGADLLLVVGTSLRVPGTKRIVREFSKAVHSRPLPSSGSQSEHSTTEMGLATPAPSPRRSPAYEEEAPIRVIYLNLDFPVPTREWDGVFDVWIRGDAQEFARMVHEELEREERAKQASAERKRRREEAALATKLEESLQVSNASGTKKRKGGPQSEARSSSSSTKKRKVAPYKPQMSKRPKANVAKVSENARLILPVVKKSRPQARKTKLTIRIPPRPEVLITTVPPKLKNSMCKSPLPTPPDSPLTPIPMSSPRPRHSRTPSSGSGTWRTAGRNIPQHAPYERTDARTGSRRGSFDWDDRSSLTELSESDEDATNESAESYFPTIRCDARRHGPGG
ncbi:DHS-like NAD/FAD-binding domain-containing protein [Laetiporus sulphureus 93-53]|uniref:DHS-like NAD/FAD-binding domain-containing protein n=1 Tax=Laetiporus sulphureus 93-53 TaxID=1314785 RepID=A0A165GNL0_9APHY|nr:DHS-like NAD/FAD-binding domain-containing protein [Laetiporus sulphureus 93-53]XP_040768335.1 DHS-like NAD/FAD-binding domain-containing protein [Laetiporus sulphureus 93-53]KZT01556.1 DHS-like NAD/FAD-binding domain-containing protein [Laetiporus sulphureus 93-53]KZT10595.1 DHS-like NAD/FAD-binding domain-containing protein [Laetiporus sulphureus 93-53]